MEAEKKEKQKFEYSNLNSVKKETAESFKIATFNLRTLGEEGKNLDINVYNYFTKNVNIVVNPSDENENPNSKFKVLERVLETNQISVAALQEIK